MPRFEELAEIVLARLHREQEQADSGGHVDGHRDGAMARLTPHWALEEDPQPCSRETLARDLQPLPLSEEEHAAIESAIWSVGTDALAFYKSIHQRADSPYPGRWGIFVLNHGVSYLAHEMQAFYPDHLSFPDAASLAAQFLYHHEYFHFMVEAWATVHEAYRDHLSYSRYRAQSYEVDFPGVCCVEESLANRHAFNLTEASRIESFLSYFMSLQPPCYAGWNTPDLNEWPLQQLLDVSVLRGEAVWSTLTLTAEDPSTCVHDIVDALYIPSSAATVGRPEDCPVYEVSVAPVHDLLQIVSPGRDEVRVFITKYLQGVPLRATSHSFYRIDNGEKVKFPNPHLNYVSLAELQNILRKAGMSFREFRDARDRTDRWKKHIPRSKPRSSIDG